MRRELRPTPAETPARKRFSKYKPEPSKTVRKAQVKESPMQKKLKAACRRYTRTKGMVVTQAADNVEFHNPKRKAIVEDMLKAIDYSAKDVEKFSLSLGNLVQSLDKGMVVEFLNYLIMHCKDSDYVVYTEGLGSDFQYFLLHNTKNVVVHGDLGWNACHVMWSGKVTTTGDAYPGLARSMQGGIIEVQGTIHQESMVAQRSTGGEIYNRGRPVRRDV